MLTRKGRLGPGEADRATARRRVQQLHRRLWSLLRQLAVRAGARERVLACNCRILAEQHKALLALVQKRAPKLADAFRARNRTIMESLRPLLSAGQYADAEVRAKDLYTCLRTADLRKGRTVRGQVNPLIALQWYEGFKTQLQRIPKLEDGLGLEKRQRALEALMKGEWSAVLSLPLEQALAESAALARCRRTDTIARKLTCLRFRSASLTPASLDKLLARGRRLRRPPAV